MYDLFSKILDMSVMGSIVILVTILMRFVLRKSSKKYVMVLWAIVAMRLLVPVSFESALSVFNYIPHKVFVTEKVEEKVTPKAKAATPVVVPVKMEPREVVPVHVAAPASRVNYKMVVAGVWGAGAVAVIGYCAVRFAMLKGRLRDAKRVEGNVYESDKVDSPFVFGLVAPKIFLPEVLESDEREYILMHERTHIRYGDWISKMVGMVAVAIHWFNPIVWLGYALFEQDLEMRCDENTVAGMDKDLKMAYTMSIVTYARKCDRVYFIVPLGFSRPNFCKKEVTSRVKNIINYKKGSKFTAIITTILMFAISTACALDSKPGKKIIREEADANAVYSESAEAADKDSTEPTDKKYIPKRSIYDMSAEDLAYYVYSMSEEEFNTFLNSLSSNELANYIDKVEEFGIEDLPEYQQRVKDDQYSTLMAKVKEEHVKDADGSLLFAFSDNSCNPGIIIYDSTDDSYRSYSYVEGENSVKEKETIFIHINPSILAAEEWMLAYDEFVKVDKITDFELTYALREPSWKYVDYLS